MKEKMPSSMISFLCGVLLMIMWTYAALSKLFVYEETRVNWMAHQLIKDYTWLLAWLVPSIELVIVLLLLFPRTVVKGFYASLVLLSVFTVYIIYMFVFYPHTPCSCGGIISALNWKEHVVFNVAFMVVSLAGVLSARIHNSYIPEASYS